MILFLSSAETHVWVSSFLGTSILRTRSTDVRFPFLERPIINGRQREVWMQVAKDNAQPMDQGWVPSLASPA